MRKGLVIQNPWRARKSIPSLLTRMVGVTEQIEKAQAWRLENAGVYYDDAEQLITAIL